MNAKDPNGLDDWKTCLENGTINIRFDSWDGQITYITWDYRSICDGGLIAGGLGIRR